MKKKFFLIGALVTISMSAMFIACSSKNAPINGCNCAVRIDGVLVEPNTPFSLEDMKYYGNFSSCDAFAAAYAKAGSYSGHTMSLSSTPY